MTDEEYQIERNSFIPEARKYANEQVDGKKLPFKWNLVFHTKMNELAIKNGLQPARGKK